MKRKIFAAAIAVCVVAVMACGSLAYYTAQSSATNRFMTASYDPEDPPIDPQPSDEFSVTITETPSEDGANEFGGNDYKNVTPGDSFVKDPTITNTGKNPMYVRATVTFSNAEAWGDALGEGVDLMTAVVTGLNLDNGTTGEWQADENNPAEDTANDTLSYVFYLNHALAPEDTATLFTGVTIPTTLDNDDMVALNFFTINVKVDAIQSANTGDDAQTAFGTPWTEATATPAP